MTAIASACCDLLAFKNGNNAEERSSVVENFDRSAAQVTAAENYSAGVSDWLEYEASEAAIQAAYEKPLNELLSEVNEEAGASALSGSANDEVVVRRDPPSLAQIAELFAPLETVSAECESGSAGRLITNARAQLVAASLRVRRNARNGRQRIIADFFHRQTTTCSSERSLEPSSRLQAL